MMLSSRLLRLLLLASVCLLLVTSSAIHRTAAASDKSLVGGTEQVGPPSQSGTDGPDLVILAVFSAQDPWHSCYLPPEVGAEVENVGTQPAGPSQVEISGSGATGYADVPALAVNDWVIVRVYLQGATSGEFTAIADADKIVDESDETNNSMTEWVDLAAEGMLCTPTMSPTPTDTPTFTPVPPSPTPTSTPTRRPGPDLIVQDMYSTQTMGNYCNTPSGLTITVENVGTDSAGASVTRVTGGMSGTVDLDTPAVAPGTIVYVGGDEFGFGGNLTATANWDHAVAESDYTNNSLTKYVAIMTLPTCPPSPTVTATAEPTATTVAGSTPDPPSVGGIAEAPEGFGATHGGGGSPVGAIAMLAGIAVVAATTGGWYARKRFGRQRR